MRLCVNDHSLFAAGYEVEAFTFLEQASRLGVAGIHFSTLGSFASLDGSYLDEVKARSDALGLSLEIGMGTCNPLSSARTARDVDRDPRDSIREYLPVAARLGSPVIRTFLDSGVERFAGLPALREMIDATVAVLRHVAGPAQDAAVTIAVENHLSLTSAELGELLDRVDSPWVGCCFDTGNQLAVLEDPVTACRRLLPFVCTTHVKDGVLLVDEPDGARWVACLAGEGSCRLEQTLALIADAGRPVRCNVEDLWDTFRVPVDDPGFISGLPHLDGQAVATVARWLGHGERLRRRGGVPGADFMQSEGRWLVVRERLPLNIERVRAMLTRHEGGTR